MSYPNRNRAETLAHLIEQRRRAAAELAPTVDRVLMIEQSIAALRDGVPIERCSLEDEPVDESGAA